MIEGSVRLYVDRIEKESNNYCTDWFLFFFFSSRATTTTRAMMMIGKYELARVQLEKWMNEWMTTTSSLSLLPFSLLVSLALCLSLSLSLFLGGKKQTAMSKDYSHLPPKPDKLSRSFSNSIAALKSNRHVIDWLPGDRKRNWSTDQSELFVFLRRSKCFRSHYQEKFTDNCSREPYIRYDTNSDCLAYCPLWRVFWMNESTDTHTHLWDNPRC